MESLRGGTSAIEHKRQYTSHGFSRHPLYTAWQGMMTRCYNQDHQAYHNYGGRGITVCPEWHDVARFITDIEATIGPRPEARYPSGRAVYTLDREDNNGNYDQGNMRWADRLMQRENQRPDVRRAGGPKPRLQITPSQRFGRLVVIRETRLPEKRGYGVRAAECVCDCGNQVSVRITSLFRGTESCGCRVRERMAELNRTQNPMWVRRSAA